ncbi:MAG: hypothetical protein MUF79_05240 [Burkholderiales bacterium]|jgi:hypothetical protein|nr:hypothetical protein [Burkholderiales bacterium]
MKPALAVFLLACSAATASAQTEQLCAQLFGTRETAIRMAQTGFPVETTVRETFARKEWRDATPEERGWAVRVIQEAYEAPGPNSEVIRVCRERAQGRPPQRRDGTTQ